MTGMKEVAIRNNLFHSNRSVALRLNLWEDTSFLVENNTIVGNRGGIEIEGKDENLQGSISGDHILKNNIVAFNTGPGLKLSRGEEDRTVDFEIKSNIVYGHDENWFQMDSQEGVNANIVRDPEFVNSSEHDYRLAAGSPAVDAGDGVDATGEDLDGNPRPFGRGIDIGAFEYVPPIHRVPDDFATIQAAIDAAGDGDLVLVSPGSYQEVLDFGGKDVSLASEEGPEATTIQGPWENWCPDGPARCARRIQRRGAIHPH